MKIIHIKATITKDKTILRVNRRETIGCPANGKSIRERIERAIKTYCAPDYSLKLIVKL